MHWICVNTFIDAPPSRCFDLARSVEAHVQSADRTGERAVAGRTSGLLALNDEVTWEGRHFGVRQRLASRITAFDRPRHFRDQMVKGAFRALEHDHYFEPTAEGGTAMTDVLRFAAPFGALGWCVERLILGPYLARFLRRRGDVIRGLAESDQWRQYVPTA